MMPIHLSQISLGPMMRRARATSRVPTSRSASGRIAARFLALILPIVLAACGSPAPQPLRFGAAPWQDGEESTYLLSSNGSPAGAATFSVTSGVEAGAGWTLRRESAGAGGQEVAVVEVGESSYRPLTSTLVRVLPDGVEQVRATYESGEVSLELVTRQNNVTYNKVNVPTDARDQRTLPFLIRTLPLAKGYATTLNTFLPYTGRLERVALQVEAQETIEVPAGSYDTWRVRLKAPEREMVAWVGVDAPHPLVRLEEGNLTFALEQ